MLLAGALLALACLPAGGRAAPSVDPTASFSPERLGHSTTIRLRIRVSAGSGQLVPPPLIAAEVRYPAGIDVQLSGLGIEACTTATLEASGLEACPPDSLMGYGSAVAELAIGGEVFRESARIVIVRSGEREDHLALLLYVYDEPAVSAQIILPSVLLPAGNPYAGRLDIEVPLVSTFPEGEDLSVGEIELVLGPKNLTYSERVADKLIHYRPAGIRLPGRCPKGGFPFAVTLRFEGGSEASERTAVACPRRGRRSNR